jgi:hypothetical protein
MDEPASNLDQPTKDFYLQALDLLEHADIQYVVAGAYALAFHAGIVRHTKDLDVFIRRCDLPRAIDAFGRAGFRAERTHPHWLAKVFARHDPTAFIDMIFRSANGLCDVDDNWLSRAIAGRVLGRPAPLCPAEEMIWSKSFVMARERYDGADINHILRAKGRDLDWDHLLNRFKGHEYLLLSHLMAYRFVYPSKPENVPDDVLARLLERARAAPKASERVTRGTLVSWDQYLPDLQQWHYQDARLRPRGTLTQEEIDHWNNSPK